MQPWIKSPTMGLFVFSVVVFLSGCFSSSRMGSKPALQVNEHVLTARDFSERLARRLKGFDALSAKDPHHIQRAKDEIVRQFVLQNLIFDFAKTDNIEVSDRELEQEVNSIRSSYPDDLSFRRMLAQENLSLIEWKENVRQSLLDQAVFKKLGAKLPKPTAEEVRKFYDEKKDRYRKKERIYLRQIVVDDLTKAQSIKEELKKTDFVQLAKKYSVSPEAKDGGLVGWVERGAVDIFDKAFLLPAGGISTVLESAYGFHLFKVERKSPPGVATLEEVRDGISSEIVAQREQAEFLGWLDKQIRQARVLKDADLIQSISVETKGKK